MQMKLKYALSMPENKESRLGRCSFRLPCAAIVPTFIVEDEMKLMWALSIYVAILPHPAVFPMDPSFVPLSERARLWWRPQLHPMDSVNVSLSTNIPLLILGGLSRRAYTNFLRSNPPLAYKSRRSLSNVKEPFRSQSPLITGLTVKL
jgi:hypothetical protein